MKNKWVEKYIVLKLEDTTKYLSIEEKTDLVHLCLKVEHGRKTEGKKENRYLVINTDEPYFNEVLKLMNLEKPPEEF